MVQGSINPKEELLAEFGAEYDKVRKRVAENQTLIDQTQFEVSRLRDRHNTVIAQLGRIEANFDTVPRSDIKSAYDSALDAKTRLLTMQGQLDKAKGTQEELQHFQQLFERLLEMVRNISPDQLPAPSSRIIPRSPSGSTSKTGALSSKAVISMVEAQEQERQRLARQMHDGPAQSLTNFILQAEICQRLFDRNPDRAGEELGNLKTAASTTFQKVRDFIFDLRPMMLDDLGLVPTIRRYVEAFQEKSNITTQLKIGGEEQRRPPAHIEVVMFRSLQTVANNARDSLGAKSISVLLDIGTEWIKTTITHDGTALDVDQTFGVQMTEDVTGLRTMKDRIQLVGGTLEVGMENDQTQFVITLPALEAAQQD